MAVQRRGYIFGAFLLSVLCVLLVVVAIASDSWVSTLLFIVKSALLPRYTVAQCFSI